MEIADDITLSRTPTFILNSDYFATQTLRMRVNLILSMFPRPFKALFCGEANLRERDECIIAGYLYI